MTDVLAPPPSPAPLRLWTPKAVGLFSIFLSFPAALALAVGNWRALGLHARIRQHILGAFALSVPLSLLLLFAPSRLGRFFAIAVNVAAFSYLKLALNGDIQAFRAASPAVDVQFRQWYTGLGWALLGLVIFITLHLLLGFGVLFLGFEIPE